MPLHDGGAATFVSRVRGVETGPEKSQFGAMLPGVARTTVSLRVVPLNEILCRSGAGPTVEPLCEKKVIEVSLLPVRIGTMCDVTHAE